MQHVSQCRFFLVSQQKANNSFLNDEIIRTVLSACQQCWIVFSQPDPKKKRMFLWSLLLRKTQQEWYIHNMNDRVDGTEKTETAFPLQQQPGWANIFVDQLSKLP